MERRQVLAALSSVAVAGIAGCTGGSGGSGGSTTTETTTEGTTTRPTYRDTAFTVENTSCATKDAEEASVSFGESAVTVTGTIIGADSCYSARVAEAKYDAEADEFTVLVESYDASEPDEMCTECITAIGYEAVASFDGGRPGTVVVKHGGWQETHTVTTASS